MVTANKVITKWNGKLSALQLLDKCEHPNPPEMRDGSSHCPDCGTELRRVLALPREDGENDLESGGVKFGRAPSAALVMDNNNGTAPGPERRRQVFSALNQGRRKRHRLPNGEIPNGEDASGVKQGLEFHVASIDLLTMWMMSGDPTDHAVSELLKATIRTVEQKRGRKIRQERVDSIARACKKGINQAEKLRRLTRQDMRKAIECGFQKEKLWPP